MKIRSLFLVDNPPSGAEARRQRRSFLLLLTTVSGIVCALLMFNFFVSLASDGGSAVMTLLSLTATAMAVCAVLLQTRLKRWLCLLCCIGMTAFVISFIVFCCLIAGYSADEEDLPSAGEPVLILVCGCRTYGDRPSRMLAGRIDAAYALLQRYPGAVCIVSGGQGSNEPVSEAYMMRKVLLEYGVAEERIIAEERSSSTKENIRFTLALMEENGWTDHAVVTVSDDYHLPRIAFLAKRYGLETALYPSHATRGFRYVAHLTREYMAYWKMAALSVFE